MAQVDSSLIGNVSFPNFLLFIFIVILTFILGSFLNTLILKLLRDKIDEHPFIYKTLAKIVMYGVYVFGLYFAFGKIIQFNIPAGLAAIGVLGIAMLLPMIPLLQNIVAGIVIALERPFNEEDIIEVDGELCKVKDIMLRKTKLRSLYGKIVIVPNLSFITGNVINYSRGEFIKVVLNIDITPDSSRDKTAEIIKKICAESPNILPHVAEKKMDNIMKIFEIPKNFFKIPRNIKNLTPRVMIKGVSREKISLEVWFWIWDIAMKERIVSSFYKKLIDEFEKEGIKFG